MNGSRRKIRERSIGSRESTGHATFPAPVATLAQGKIWLAADVEAWLATRRR